MTGNFDRVPELELLLDHDRRRATRGTRPFVEFGGNTRLWQLLAALARRYDAYYRTYDLIDAVWKEYRAEPGTLFGAISDLRKMLRALDLTVKHYRNLGYRLKDLRKHLS